MNYPYSPDYKRKKSMMKSQIRVSLDQIDRSLERMFGKGYLYARNVLKNTIKYAGIRRIQIVDLEHASFEQMQWHYELPLEQKKIRISVALIFRTDAGQFEKQLASVFSAFFQTGHKAEVIILADETQKKNVEESVERVKKSINVRSETGRMPDIVKLKKFFENGIKKSVAVELWNLIICEAECPYIWILDEKDFCKPEFLKAALSYLSYQSTMLVFSEQKGTDSFQMAAPLFTKHFFSKKNPIQTSGFAIFRNPGKIPANILASFLHETDEQVQIWLFYLWLIRGGTVACVGQAAIQGDMPNTCKAVNRQSMSDITKSEVPQSVSRFVDDLYSKNRYFPNVLMCCSDFMLGGGETFALHLSNELYHQGVTVTVLDFHMYQFDENIRKLLNPAIPVVKISDVRELGNIIRELDGDIIHSHHGNVDEVIAVCLQRLGVILSKRMEQFRCRQIITLHGMYEAMPEMDCRYLLQQVSKTCSAFIYIADKNLVPFKKYGYLSTVRLIKMANGLPDIVARSIKRSEMGISENAFVLCLASRGIPEKGWKEGIQAVQMARKKTGKDIHLLILGDGKMRTILEPGAPEFIHFTGTVHNVRDYFAMADAGFLPSYFQGESFPLVVIEALMCGKPVIATDIGEVKNQLLDEDGKLAGELIPLSDWKMDTEYAAEIIARWADNKEIYGQYKKRVTSAAKKFDISHIAEQYLQVYRGTEIKKGVF